MNDKKIEMIIKHISKLFKEKFTDFIGIYFYGSRVRGKFLPDSDYDLIFVFEREITWQFKEKIRHIIYEFEDKYDIFIDSKIVSSKEIDMNRMPLIQNVKKEGIFYGV
jgi:predicted nucleotidyltransferase